MADNYIEKQMDALRSGKLSIKARPGIKPRGKRILVAGGCQGETLEKALEYRNDAHRVAIFDEDEGAGKRLAHDHGIRFHRVCLTDATALQRETQALLRTWRGIDTIIGSEDTCKLIKDTVANWKESLPLPDKTHTEIVIVAEIIPHDES